MDNFNAGDVIIIKGDSFIVRKKDGKGGYIESELDLDASKIAKIKQNAEKRGIRIEYNYDSQNTEFEYKIIDNAKSYDSDSSLSEDVSDDVSDDEQYEDPRSFRYV